MVDSPALSQTDSAQAGAGPVGSPRAHTHAARLPRRWRAYVVPALMALVVSQTIAIAILYNAPRGAAVSPGVDRHLVPSDPAASITTSDAPSPTAPDVLTSAGTRAAPAERSTPTLPTAVTASARTGWIEVRSPLDVDVWEGRRRVGEGSQARIELTEGDHQVELVNDQVGFREALHVHVTRGRVATISPVLPMGTLHVNAAPWAEVWLDGQALGATPLGNVRASLGGHELVFRHPQLGTRNVRVIVTAGAPVRSSVDMREQ